MKDINSDVDKDKNEVLDTTLHLSEVSGFGMKSNAFIILPPANKKIVPAYAIFAHGYTSHKGTLLNWASRLSDGGVSCLLFDLPGHHLGSFNQVPSFETFRNNAHEFFYLAFEKLQIKIKEHFPLEHHKFGTSEMTLILGGHSLGGLLALKSMNLPALSSYKKFGIGVGLGLSLSNGNKTHLFESDFFKKTLNFRQQLVSPELHPENVFPWIKNEKEHLSLHSQNICLITGEDDVVSPPRQTQELADRLIQQKNKVTVMFPKRLSHHQPELAASSIGQYLKGQNIF